MKIGKKEAQFFFCSYHFRHTKTTYFKETSVFVLNFFQNETQAVLNLRKPEAHVLKKNVI